MQIAELFVALGVKGSEKTLGALASTRLSLSSISSTALEAKVAILGMAYALERLTSGAATDASNLKGFAAFIDSSVEDVERWEYAGKRAGLTIEAMRNSLAGVYKIIQDNATTPGKLPFGAKVFAEETQLNTNEPLNYQDILRKAVQFAHSKRYPQTVRNAILQSLGLGSDLIGRIESGQFKLSNVDRAPILSNNEINSLSNVKSQFADIEEKVKLFFGHFTAKHGKEIVDIIKNITMAILGLATQIDNLASKFHVFENMDNALKNIKLTLGDVSSEKDATRLRKDREQEIKDSKELYAQYQRILEADKKFNKNTYSPSNYSNTDQESLKKIGDFYSIIQGGAHTGLSNFIKGGIDLIFGNQQPWQNQLKNIFDYTNIVPSPSFPNNNQNTSINVTQNISMTGDGTNYNDIGNMHQTAVQRMIVDTMSQLPRGRQTI